MLFIQDIKWIRGSETIDILFSHNFIMLFDMISLF